MYGKHAVQIGAAIVVIVCAHLSRFVAYPTFQYHPNDASPLRNQITTAKDTDFFQIKVTPTGVEVSTNYPVTADKKVLAFTHSNDKAIKYEAFWDAQPDSEDTDALAQWQTYLPRINDDMNSVWAGHAHCSENGYDGPDEAKRKKKAPDLLLKTGGLLWASYIIAWLVAVVLILPAINEAWDLFSFPLGAFVGFLLFSAYLMISIYALRMNVRVVNCIQWSYLGSDMEIEAYEANYKPTEIYDRSRWPWANLVASIIVFIWVGVRVFKFRTESEMKIVDQ